jgi:uncharacterized protein
MSGGTQFAVVTGASSGIGFGLAAQFAMHGFDVLAVAEDDKIQQAASLLTSGGGGKVEPFQADLANFEGVNSLVEKIRSTGRPVDAIAVNAGVGLNGPFADSNLEAQLNLINLNVTSAVHLTHEVLRDMVDRRAGRILITSSIAATMPGPFDTTYHASKAFLKLFAEGLRGELEDSGVTVTALMPGATETNFFDRAGHTDTKLGQGEKDPVTDVARDGYEALMAGKDHVVAGSFKNKLEATIAHILPDTVTAKIAKKGSTPGSADR